MDKKYINFSAIIFLDKEMFNVFNIGLILAIIKI